MTAKSFLKGTKGVSLVALGTLGVVLGANIQKAETEKKQENGVKASVVKLPGSKVRLLFPEGYEKLKYTNPIKNAAMNVAGKDAAYRKTVDTSDNMVLIRKVQPNEAMDPDDLKGLIDGIHNCLSDNQGLIEVKNGITSRGYKYIYSIVKNLQDQMFGGVRYFLRLNLFYEGEILEIQADFTEINTTGMRETVCMDLARRAGLADISKDGFKDWSQDPYDPEFRKGCLKNLAEKEGLDAMFPNNPLTQAHEFLLAVLEDKYVRLKRDVDDEEEEPEKDDDKESSREEQERAFLLKIFVDECKRITYPVDVTGAKEASS